MGPGDDKYSQLSSILSPAPKRKIFVCYHHHGDQGYYNAFVNHFEERYEVFTDRSLERAYDSDDDTYVRFQIRSNDIAGTSCTIVLCGAYTHQRKYVDWEIKATLDKQHGLIGVWLPTLPLLANNGTQKPARLQDNLDSGFAKWIAWGEATVDKLKATIEAAVGSPKSLIDNSRPLRVRNG